ncbi:MAG: DUF4263 domain-containing protein [Alphaproteobacteria bacterium]|nr:DUF4263 domain-containing protein [Alphaproteobacteria bacterium]
MLRLENSNNRKHPELSGMDIVNRKLNEKVVHNLETAITAGSETKIHKLLASNAIVFEPLLDRVGHHAMWSKNKPQIRPKLTNGKNGKIPDLLIAGKGSGGIEWFFVELKSPKEKLFTKNKTFGHIANAGLNQLAEYIIYGTEKQGSIRDALEIKDFKNPKGIFIIGNEDETKDNEDLQQLKSFWNDQLHSIKIVSYSQILRNAQKLMLSKIKPT